MQMNMNMVMVGRRKRRRQFGEKNSTFDSTVEEDNENVLDKVKQFGQQLLDKIVKHDDSGKFANMKAA